jgi:hypothetical protein
MEAFMKRFIVVTSVFLFGLLALFGIMSKSPEVSANVLASNDARVRVAHVSPDAPNVDVWVDGSLAFENVAFEDVTDYAALAPGSYLVQVEATGGGGSGPFVISETLALAADTDYTVAAVDELASIEALVLTDDNTLPDPGKAHVRFVHASPDAPAVDITLPDGTPIFSNIDFKEVGAYTPVAAGTYDLEVRPTGTSNSVLDLMGLEFKNKTVYTVFATGYAGGGPPALNAILAEDAGEARVRVAHLSPDAPAVDVWVDGAKAFENLAFEDISDYAILPSDIYDIEVVPNGATTPVVISATLDLKANMDYTVAAVNELASIEALVLEDDNTLPAFGMAHVRFVHASPDAPAVDITLPDGTPIFSDIEFKEVGAYTPVPATTYDLEVRLAGTDTIVLELDGLEFMNKTVYTVFATGYATGGTPALNAILSEDAGEARVRVAHLSPDAPAVDVWVDSVMVLENLAFEEVSSYAILPADSYFIEVVPNGATTPVVISATLDLKPNMDYTVAAVNELASIEALVLEDDNTLPMAGKAHVRFVHASPDAPAVDITLPDGTPIFSNIAFKEVGDYTPVAAGTYDLEVRPTGTDTSVLDLMGLEFDNKVVYTVFATGYAGGGTPALNAILVEDAGEARVRVAHLSPDAPAVDILVDSVKVIENLAFEELSDYATLPIGSYFIEVVPSGSTTPVVISATLDLKANMDYTVAAVNELASIEALVLEDDNTLPDPGKAHVRFVHASPDAPAVDITLPDGTAIFSNIAFKEVGDYTPVDKGTYDLEVRPTGTDTSVLDLMGLDFDSMTVYTVFATGYATGGTPALNAILETDAGPVMIYMPILYK